MRLITHKNYNLLCLNTITNILLDTIDVSHRNYNWMCNDHHHKNYNLIYLNTIITTVFINVNWNINKNLISEQEIRRAET